MQTWFRPNASEIGLIGRLPEHVAEDAVGTAEIVDRFQQGHDRQRHVRDVLAGRAQAAEPDHRQHVAGVMGHAHDQGPQRPGPVAGRRAGEQAEQVERFAGGGTEPFGHQPADGVAGRLGKQEGLLAILAQAAEVDAQAQFRGKFLHRAAEPAGLLADVQFGGMKTEHGDAVEPLLDQALGQGLMPAFPQRVGDQLHVRGEFLGTAIGRCQMVDRSGRGGIRIIRHTACAV